MGHEGSGAAVGGEGGRSMAILVRFKVPWSVILERGSHEAELIHLRELHLK